MILKYLEERKVVFVFIPLIVYWLILFIATSLPASELPSISYNDKVVHFLAFGGLGFLLTLAFMLQDKYRELRGYALLAAVVIASIYAALDEFHQSFIPGRSAEMLDWVADFLGALTGAILCSVLTGLEISRKKSAEL